MQSGSPHVSLMIQDVVYMLLFPAMETEQRRYLLLLWLKNRKQLTQLGPLEERQQQR